ncbi:MAG: rhomboid family intramembrane serine protease [Cyanobacteria bacterium P01_D01_bin.128]
MESHPRGIAQELKQHAVILGGLILLLWILEAIDVVVFQQRLNQYGIRPRELSGLWGILFAPFLHGGFDHLIANTVPLLTLGWLVMVRDIRDFWVVSVIGVVLGGLGTWLVGAGDTVHIGASGLVFSYFGFLLMRGYFERSVIGIALAVVVFMLYGGLIWGILPNQPGISWEGHLFGFVGGAIAARLLARKQQSRLSKSI